MLCVLAEVSILIGLLHLVLSLSSLDDSND